MIKGIKLAVIGSRSFTEYELLDKTLKEIDAKTPISLIISGGAVGADSFANQWAKENGKSILIIYPEWNKNGAFDKGAGFKRNFKVVEACDEVIAFTNGSQGTAHSIEAAKGKNKPITIIPFMEPQSFHAYVDGSFIDNKVKYGTIIKNKSGAIVDSFSGIIDKEGIESMRQIGGELRGATTAISWAKSKKDKVIIYYDYEGIYNWVADAFGGKPWKTNNEFTKAYREYVLENLTYIEKFVKVKAHTGIKGNEEVDKLAKNAK
jgi:ribonuclease HI